eukprot:3948721-Amphidinium_carterae.1
MRDKNRAPHPTAQTRSSFWHTICALHRLRSLHTVGHCDLSRDRCSTFPTSNITSSSLLITDRLF